MILTVQLIDCWNTVSQKLINTVRGVQSFKKGHIVKPLF